MSKPPAYEAEPQDGPIPDGLYVLTNIKSRTVLDLHGGNSGGGTHCAGFARNTNDCIDHQLWIVKHDTSNDTYTLRNLRGGTYLDLQAGYVLYYVETPRFPIRTPSLVLTEGAKTDRK
ncbi:hypothetical protein FRC01_005146 [Tulasnella sp. 417]|nr:hypothetical protein FRC01_005146 [Tulasnella sp. 417]